MCFYLTIFYLLSNHFLVWERWMALLRFLLRAWQISASLALEYCQEFSSSLQVVDLALLSLASLFNTLICLQLFLIALKSKASNQIKYLEAEMTHLPLAELFPLNLLRLWKILLSFWEEFDILFKSFTCYCSCLLPLNNQPPKLAA